MRATAYFFGLVYGYFLHRIQAADYKLTKVNGITLFLVIELNSCVNQLWFHSMFCVELRDNWLGAGVFIINHFDVLNWSVLWTQKKLWSSRVSYLLLNAPSTMELWHWLGAYCLHYRQFRFVLFSIYSCLEFLDLGDLCFYCIKFPGPIRNFLKWRPFTPLSRLTYSAYLVNGLVELHGISTTRTPQHLDNLSLVSAVFIYYIKKEWHFLEFIILDKNTDQDNYYIESFYLIIFFTRISVNHSTVFEADR